jgi:hypothetical protein
MLSEARQLRCMRLMLCLVGPYTHADGYKSSCETRAQNSDISTNVTQPKTLLTQLLRCKLQIQAVTRRNESGTRSLEYIPSS